MHTRIRSDAIEPGLLARVAAIGALVLAGGGTIQAGTNAAAVQWHQAREQAKNAAPAPEAPAVGGTPTSQGRPPEGRPPGGRPPQGAPPSQGRPPQGRPPQGRPPQGGPPPQGRPPQGGYQGGNRGGYYGNGGNHNYRPPPPRHVVPTLPPGYARHYWRGNPYYYHGGYWYRPYGSYYSVVAAPYGLYVPYLPGYYSSLWFGGTRYFYADSTYYIYDATRRGYIVSRSPYDEGSDDQVGEFDDETLYVYPSRGQSEQQQADDRYECHRWAVDQTGYDPVESDHDSARREEYSRAITACLTGRGYSVR